MTIGDDCYRQMSPGHRHRSCHCHGCGGSATASMPPPRQTDLYRRHPPQARPDRLHLSVRRARCTFRPTTRSFVMA